LWWLGVVEVFIAKVFAGGKVTVPQRVRGLLNIEDGDYVRLSLSEVVKKAERTRGGRRPKAT